MNNPAIKVENLQELELQAVQGISFEVYAAGFLGLAVWRFRFE